MCSVSYAGVRPAGCGGGSLGSYSESVGVEVIRRHVAQYIEERDGGIACDYNNVILSGGASEAIKVRWAGQPRSPQCGGGLGRGLVVHTPQGGHTSPS